MIVELKKGYTIESRYDKFSDSYITRLLDNESKQVGDTLSSKDIVGKNQDIKSVRDYFTNYINNKRVEEEIPDEIDYIEPEEEFEEEEDIFEESLNLEDFDSIFKQKARKTKKATRKAKLPALSKMSPIMPDYTKSIDAFNFMQADGNSSMGSTTGSISLGEEFKDRNSLIKELQNMGFNYKFDKYSDKQLYRIYQERTKAAKKKEAEKREQQKASSLADHKKENAKDSYFRDGIEFESEDAAREYFGESMSRPYHWDVDEIERIILKAWEDADLRLRRDNIHISRHDNWCFVEIEYIDDWTFKHINKAWIKKTLKKELGLSEIKQSSWKNDGWGSRDYGKTLRYDMYVSDEQGMNESMDNKFYLNDMHKAWDIIDPEDEISIPTTHSNLNESFSGKSTKQFNTITEGLKFFENKCFDETCEDIQLESLFESMRDKLSSDDIKKLGAFMNHAQDADEVLTYMKGLLSEELTAEQKGDLGLLYDEICYNDLEPTFDYTFDEDTGINRDPYNEDKAILCFHIKGDMAELDRIVERIEYRVGNYNFIMVDNDFDIVSRPNGSTWAECYLFITVKADNSIKEDFDLDEFKDNLEREKDYYGEKAQGLKMLAFPLKRKIEKICNDFWADEYATAVDDLNDEISFAYEVEGDWKHDHLRFQNAVLNMLYEEGYEDVNHYEDIIDDDGSDTYRAIHTFEINASKQNQLSESLNEPFLHTTAPGEIDMAIEYFLEECKYSGYKAEITEVAEEDGYFMISGYIDDDVRSETSPSEILDILLDQLDMFDISVDVYTNWRINRLYRRMQFEIATKYHLENVNESLKEDWSWPEENGYINDAHERIAFILDELAKIGFKHDEKYPIRDGLFGRKHIQIINPDLITSEETFEEDIKPLVDVLNNIEETFGETARMTYNIGANDDLQVTAGIDVGAK